MQYVALYFHGLPSLSLPDARTANLEHLYTQKLGSLNSVKNDWLFPSAIVTIVDARANYCFIFMLLSLN